MFNDLPPINLESDQGFGSNTMASHGPSGWRPTATPCSLEGLTSLSFRTPQAPWNSYKPWDDSRVHWPEQERSFSNDLPSWRSEYFLSEVNNYFPNHAKYIPLAPLNPSIASPGYIVPCSDDRLMSEQSSSPGGSSWSPEPSEGQLEFESGDARSRREYDAAYRSACTRSDRGFSQSFSCHSPSFSEVSSYADSRSNSGIKLQDVQQYPDTFPEEYENKISPTESSSSEQYNLSHPAPWSMSGTIDSNQYNHHADTTPVSREDLTPQILESEDIAMKTDTASEGENDSGSDYTPGSCKTTGSSSKHNRLVREQSQAKTIKRNPVRTKAKCGQRSKTYGVTKRLSKRSSTMPTIIASTDGKELATSCSQCSLTLPTKSALKKHISGTHTRPFTCTFRLYGCSATFGSKNEWKRHVSSQHLRLGIWRCDLDSCLPQQTLPSATLERPPRKGRQSVEEVDVEELVFNDFNRKDLFTQHLRRMHAPRASCPAAEHEKFNASLDLISKRCLKNTREPPSYSVCGYCPPESTGNGVIFQGPGSWENRMEHVGRHLESGHGQNRAWREDTVLRDWMVREGLIEETKSGVWRLQGMPAEEDQSRRIRR